MNNNLAVPFISYSEKDGFSLNPEAEQFLSSLDPQRKVGVISIAGKYRTGKSFLVNRVILDIKGEQNQGFQVGPTVNPCTKGLWLYKKTLTCDDENTDILIIDTEGFGGMDENVSHDSRILLLSLLCSSYFIFNSVGNIDENALNNLSLIINLAKDIQIKTNSNSQSQSDEVSQYFPSFLWVLRDFALKLVDQNGCEISQKDYLEKAIENQKGISDAIEQKNRIRRMFKHFFKDRDCNTLVRPMESEQDLQNLNTMSDDQLRPEFLEQITLLKKKIFKKVKPKYLQGKALNGQMLIDICKSYMYAINKGQSPNIENAWTYLCKSEFQKALNESLKMTEDFLSQQTQALSSDQILVLKEKIREMVQTNLKKKAIGSETDLKEHYTQVEAKIEVQMIAFRKKNKLLQVQEYDNQCKKYIKSIEENLQNKQYQHYYDFQADFLKFKEFFESKIAAGSGKEKYWVDISEKLHRLAAEKMANLIESKSQNEKKLNEKRMEMLQYQFDSKVRDHESEKTLMMQRTNDLEQNMYQNSAMINIKEEKIQNLVQEYRNQVQINQELQSQHQEKIKEIEHNFQQSLKQVQQQLDQERAVHIKQGAHLDKNQALLEQENMFHKREIQQITVKCQVLEQENIKYRNDLQIQTQQVEVLKNKLNDQVNIRQNDQERIKQEYDMKVTQCLNEKEMNKELQKQNNELTMEKTYMESQVNFLKNQLEENKRLHDALLLALQQGIGNQDSENNNELVETNKNLSAAVDRMEMRCKILEEKNEQLKSYKKIIKNCFSLQCIHCSKFISTSIFSQHLNKCIQNTEGQQQCQVKHTSTNSISGNPQIQLQLSYSTYINQPPPLFFNFDANDLRIIINQTMVRESPDNKPYTEYLIQLQYQSLKWTVARKYKQFCQLHSDLTNNFPGLKFPESSFSIINSNTDINNVFNQGKRPTVIEDRRKALQQYLIDLTKIDVVVNCQIFKNFLDVSSNLMQKGCNYEVFQDEKQLNPRNLPLQVKQQDYTTSHMKNDEYNPNVRKQDEYNPNVKKQDEYNPNVRKQTTSNFIIDKKMMPQSPKSFLKEWKLNQKENNNDISKYSDIQSQDYCDMDDSAISEKPSKQMSQLSSAQGMQQNMSKLMQQQQQQTSGLNKNNKKTSEKSFSKAFFNNK